MQVKFPGVEVLETAPKFRNFVIGCLRPPETNQQEISRPSRVVTAKKCTKRCNAQAELLFSTGY